MAKAGSTGSNKTSVTAHQYLRGHYTSDLASGIGLTLALSIVSTWLAAYVLSMFAYSWGPHSILTAPLLAAVLCWLYVGLFIVAHDCMHGSLLPRKPRWNRLIGRTCLLLYAGFDYDNLKQQHALHHRHAGTDQDPDFDGRTPRNMLRWYTRFFMTYFEPYQVALMAALSLLFLFALDANYANLIAFWALPAILSSVQLFYFGTYRPHRPGAEPFPDRHRARGSEDSWWLSLLSCYHFGHHHAHHRYPFVPWWGLPALGKTQRNSERPERHTKSGETLAQQGSDLVGWLGDKH